MFVLGLSRGCTHSAKQDPDPKDLPIRLCEILKVKKPEQYRNEDMTNDIANSTVVISVVQWFSGSVGPEFPPGLHLFHPQLVLLEPLPQFSHLLPLCLPLLELVEIWLLVLLAPLPLLTSCLGGGGQVVHCFEHVLGVWWKFSPVAWAVSGRQ